MINMINMTNIINIINIMNMNEKSCINKIQKMYKKNKIKYTEPEWTHNNENYYACTFIIGKKKQHIDLQK